MKIRNNKTKNILFRYVQNPFYQNQQNTRFNPNISQISNNLNTSGTNDTIKILNILKNENENNNIQNDNENKLESIREYTFEDIKGICLKVFMYFAKPKNGQFYLSYQSLFKILKNCGIIDEKNVKTKDVEIIVQRINKGIKNYTSENFLDLLTKICMCINKNFYDDKKGTFSNFIRTFLEPYCLEMDKISEIEITQKTKNNDLTESKNSLNSNLENNNRIKLNIPLNFKKFIENYSFDQLSFLILSSILEGLKQIYKYYFIYEINNYIDLKKIEKNSFKNYLTFCREFQIFPYLINKNLLELYWSIVISNSLETLINNPNISLDKFNQNSYNIGTIYTFPKFVLLFSHIASFYFYTIEISKSEKLLYLIEKIYHSKGYVNFNKNICSTYNKKFCIVPPKDVIELINKKLLEDDNKNLHFNIGNFVSIQSFLGLNNENYMKLRKYLEKLKYIFNVYSQLVDKFQYGKLSFSNYQKLLYDGGLLRIKKTLNLKNSTILTQRQNNFISYSLIKNKNNLDENYKLNKSNSQPNILKNNSLLNISQGSYLDSPIYNDVKKDKLNLVDINIICSTISGYINCNLENSENKKNNNWISNFNLNNSSILNSSTSRNNNIYKFDFYLFLKSLPLISLRLYPNEKNDINESMSYFLDEKMNDFIEKLSGVLNIYSLVPEVIKLINIFSTNEKIQELIKDITPLIKSHFLNYADKKTNLINFDNFSSFFKDFDIYPHWLSLSNLREIFFAGCSKGQYKKEELIDYKIFIQCFVVIGISINSGDDFDWIDKVLFMIDKMFVEGGEKSVSKSGKLFTSKYDYNFHEKILMKKYPSYYKRKYNNCDYRYDNQYFYENNYYDDQTKINEMNSIKDRKNIKFNDIFLK